MQHRVMREASAAASCMMPVLPPLRLLVARTLLGPVCTWPLPLGHLPRFQCGPSCGWYACMRSGARMHVAKQLQSGAHYMCEIAFQRATHQEKLNSRRGCTHLSKMSLFKGSTRDTAHRLEKIMHRIRRKPIQDPSVPWRACGYKVLRSVPWRACGYKVFRSVPWRACGYKVLRSVPWRACGYKVLRSAAAAVARCHRTSGAGVHHHMNRAGVHHHMNRATEPSGHVKGRSASIARVTAFTAAKHSSCAAATGNGGGFRCRQKRTSGAVK
jgi:hypothetical protein